VSDGLVLFLAIALNYLKRDHCIGKYLPQSHSTVFHYRFPGHRETPALAFVVLEAAGAPLINCAMFQPNWYGTGRCSDRVIGESYPLATASGSVIIQK